jgi:hypothetical protein
VLLVNAACIMYLDDVAGLRARAVAYSHVVIL